MYRSGTQRSSRQRSPRRGSRGRGGYRRTNVWVRVQQAGIPAVGTAGNHPFDLLPDGLIDHGAVVGSTVVRVRGEANVNAGTLTNAYGGVFLAFAILDRSAEPLEDLPEPYANANDVDWMYWRFFSLSNWELGIFSDDTTTSAAINVDVKSSRRIIAPQQTLIGMIQVVSVASTPPPAYNMTFSTLLKLA